MAEDKKGYYFHQPGKLSKCGVLDVGLKCTHSCKYCFYSFLDGSNDQFKGLRNAKFKTLTECKEILTFLKEKGLRNFDVTGGEPTLHPDIIEIIRFAHQDLELSGRIITLGQFLMKKMPKVKLNFLIEDLLDAGLTNLDFSIPAISENDFKAITSESFKRLNSAMTFLDERGFQYTSHTTIIDLNYKELPKIAEEVLKHNIYSHNFDFMSPYYENKAKSKVNLVQAKNYEIYSYLKEAVNLLEEHNVSVNINNVPFCSVKGLEKNVVSLIAKKYDPYEWMNDCSSKSLFEIEEGNIESKYEYGDYYKYHDNGILVSGVRGEDVKHFGETCVNCTMKNICDGIDPLYLQNNGSTEFIPYDNENNSFPLHSDRYNYTPTFLVKTDSHFNMKEKIKNEFNNVKVNASGMVDEPLISIIITNFNYSNYLEDAVQSIISQSYQNWECIIVNDGSKDDFSLISKSIVEKNKQYNISIINKENGGIADAKNAGIENCNGTWILTLDSDDKLANDYLEKAIDLIKKNSIINLVYSNIKTFGKEEVIWDFDKSSILEKNIFPSASIFKRELWQKVHGFNIVLGKFLQFEAWDFWIKCSSIGIIPISIEEPKIYKRLHSYNNLYNNILINEENQKAFTASANSYDYTQEQIQSFWEIISNSNDEVIKKISYVIDRFPKESLPYLWRGLVYQKKNEKELAINDFKHSIQLNEYDWQAYYCLAQILLSTLNEAKSLKADANELLNIAKGLFDKSKLLLSNKLENKKLILQSNTEEKVEFPKSFNLLFYHSGLTNNIENLNGGSRSVFEVSKKISEINKEWGVYLSGNFVHKIEKELNFNFLPIEKITEDIFAKFDVVIFVSQLNGFEKFSKSENQKWILYQNQWEIGKPEIDRIKDFDLILALSNIQKYSLLRQAPLTKIEVVPNSINTSIFTPVYVKRKRKSLMFAGALNPKKGLHILLEAFLKVKELHPEAELNIYGSSSILNDNEDYEKKIKSIKLPDVHYKGLVKPQDMPGIYSLHEFLILPSNVETFSLVSIEAQACGCIPIVHNSGGASATLIDNQTGLLYQPNTPKNLAESICFAFDNVNNDFRKNAVKFINKNYSTKVVAQNFNNILNKCFENNLTNSFEENEKAELLSLVHNLISTEKLDHIIVTGSSSLLAESFLSGVNENENLPTLHSLELNKERFEYLKSTFEISDSIKFYNLPSVSSDRILKKEEVVNFYNNVKTKLNQFPLDLVLSWYDDDLELETKFENNIDGIKYIKNEFSISEFDLAVINGNPFFGKAEFQDVYGSRIIILDDVLDVKNYENYIFLKNDPIYTLISENLANSGYAAFKKLEKIEPKIDNNVIVDDEELFHSIPKNLFISELNEELKVDDEEVFEEKVEEASLEDETIIENQVIDNDFMSKDEVIFEKEAGLIKNELGEINSYVEVLSIEEEKDDNITIEDFPIVEETNIKTELIDNKDKEENIIENSIPVLEDELNEDIVIEEEVNDKEEVLPNNIIEEIVQEDDFYDEILQEEIPESYIDIEQNTITAAAKVNVEELEFEGTFEDVINKLNSMELDKSLTIPDLISIKNYKGDCYLHLGLLEEAKKCFNLAYNLDSSSSKAIAGLGNIVLIEGLLEARKMFELAVKFDDKNFAAKEQLNLVNEILKRKGILKP